MIDYATGDARFGKGLKYTFEETVPGQLFEKKHPAAARCMSDLELHPSHSSVHAAGIIVCNDKISDYCTVNEEGVAQIDKPNAEYLNLLKIDALGLRTLGIIEDSGCVTAEELYSLKLNDQNVFDILNENKVSGIFQFEGDAVQSVTKNVYIDMFSKIDNLTALARPGPLASGMAKKYIDRVNGKEKITYDIPQLEPYLKDTYGVVLYQESVMSISKEIGLFDWATIAIIRKAMSGSKGEEYFNQMGEKLVIGATSQGIMEDQARKIWREIVTFGSWAFNKSHSVSYAIVTYWTCWLKRYHKLEFAAACLRSAKDDNQTIAILRELGKEGVEYTAIDPDYSDMNWKAVDGRLVGGIQNAKGYGPVKSLQYIQKREAGKLTDKDKERLAKAEILYKDLAEAHTKWGHYYRNPSLAGVTSGNPITEIKSVPGGDTCLIIGKLTKKILADENEAIRIKKRGGSLWNGPSAFLDLMLVDDSTDYPFRFRIRANLYEQYGLKIANESKAGNWFLVKAWHIKNSEMFIIKNIKSLE
jgi:DNA polymerase III alpha subunit